MLGCKIHKNLSPNKLKQASIRKIERLDVDKTTVSSTSLSYDRLWIWDGEKEWEEKCSTIFENFNFLCGYSSPFSTVYGSVEIFSLKIYLHHIENAFSRENFSKIWAYLII